MHSCFYRASILYETRLDALKNYNIELSKSVYLVEILMIKQIEYFVKASLFSKPQLKV